MSWELIRESQVVSKKVRACIWCGEDIPAGEKHAYQVGRFDSDLQTSRWHLECQHAAQTDFDWNETGGEFNPGEMKRGTAEWKDA